MESVLGQMKELLQEHPDLWTSFEQFIIPEEIGAQAAVPEQRVDASSPPPVAPLERVNTCASLSNSLLSEVRLLHPSHSGSLLSCQTVCHPLNTLLLVIPTVTD